MGDDKWTQPRPCSTTIAVHMVQLILDPIPSQTSKNGSLLSHQFRSHFRGRSVLRRPPLSMQRGLTFATTF